MTRVYLQERWPASPEWSDAIYETAPTIKAGRIVLNGSIGPRVRNVTPLEGGHEKLTLAQARAVYTPDGHLRFTG